MPTAKITDIKKALKLDASRLLRMLVAGAGFEPTTVMRIKNLKLIIILKNCINAVKVHE